MAALMRARASPAAFRVLAAASRTYGTSLPVPTPPPGTEMVFHSRNQQPKYSLSNPKWFSIFFACNIGAYLGHYFYLKALMPANPPNPPRDPDEPRPEKHMHSVDDD
uniref:Uncharacterized protein n=1 Tax=Alexandrium monilatum TaxID=311494 RepID=A0A7S4R877_9DINO|mmetsp:Transcript_16113/g.50536  ORF Transcript_16113/g.50536 Transcript_16113/m.50536 type:complete len:107 (-) Transcript_16113:118-438(-)